MSYSDLDLNLIKTFSVVYETRSLLGASKKLFVSQPALTSSIKRFGITPAIVNQLKKLTCKKYNIK